PCASRRDLGAERFVQESEPGAHALQSALQARRGRANSRQALSTGAAPAHPPLRSQVKSLAGLTSLEHDTQIVRRHRHGLQKDETASGRFELDISQESQAPSGIALPQA